MQRILAIALLTWKAAFRFRLFWVLAALLMGSVVILPLLLKHDGTARGFTQILLTYTLSLITALLGLATMWLACGTLARDIEDCQMQMVAVKPIARWQIWLGKWTGLLLVNGSLLLLAGASVYTLLMWRAQQLPPDQQRLLRNEIFVARASLKEPPRDLEHLVEQTFRERLKQTPVPAEEQPALRSQIRELYRAGTQVVPPGFRRTWKLNLGLKKTFLRGEPLYVRARFHAAQTNMLGTYQGRWIVGPPDSDKSKIKDVSMAADTFHEFEIPSNMFDSTGELQVSYHNVDSVTLLFPMEDGLEVLYREGGFALNYFRGLLVILCWLALVAAMGLAAASFLSFPVAAFVSVSVLFVAFSSGSIATAVAEGTVLGVNHETGEGTAMTWLDNVLLPFFKLILNLLDLTRGVSPVEALSTGRSITWGQLAVAFGQIVLLLGGALAALGIFVFTRRELATAQGTE
jgi:ABC-type transport system involved in multi-copper enzyme maturation permease subunit